MCGSRSGGEVVHTAATSVERGPERSDWLRAAGRFRLSAARFRRGGVPCARRMHKEEEPRNSLASTLISVARFGKQLDFLLLDSMWTLIW
ncbi:hypothetical protein GQ55_1G306900 [Panicum hallii var. hallii]|uniref:Uncharacterized protein n=1 Tax=Panicum hallii var. hallii TaxID=1504633 RepID=A0A2T7F980_9POAL|nr:hypothetical protein GQ55_1G306900 [Panicum hallii var. hallii]